MGYAQIARVSWRCASQRGNVTGAREAVRGRKVLTSSGRSDPARTQGVVLRMIESMIEP